MKHIYADLPELPKKISQKKKRPRTLAIVFEGHCTGCEVCVPFCPVDCISRQDGPVYADRPIPPVQIRFDECIGCQICVRVCSKLTWDAIRMVPTEKVEEALSVKIGETYEEATANKTNEELNQAKVREVSNQEFTEYWRS